MKKKKENRLLEERVSHRTAQLNSKMDELKATQSQLIQSEKMASLGELSAGIAQEMQNPLNFVNNFSEVNTELIDEMEDEIKKGDYEEALALSKDIKENQKKNYLDNIFCQNVEEVGKKEIIIFHLLIYHNFLCNYFHLSIHFFIIQFILTPIRKSSVHIF